jgi:hypothetical protein
MADGDYGERIIDIDIDLVTTARSIRPGANDVVKIVGIVVNGVGPATGPNGRLTLRKESASGPIVWQMTPDDNEPVKEQQSLSILCNKLYMDTMTQSWAAGSKMLIYTS